MSLLAKNTGLIILSALFIFSCKEKEKLGLQPQENVVGTFYSEDLITLKTTAVLKNDDITTHNKAYVYAGAFADEEFGDVYAEAYTQLLLAKPSVAIPATAIVQSVEMNLAYDYYYGDTTESQTIEVHKLSGPLEDKSYITTSDRISSAGRIDSDIAFNVKGVKAPAIQNIKIKLDSTFGAEILSFNSIAKSNDDFLATYKGIALIPQDQDKGAVLGIKLSGNGSKITIYYKLPPNDSIYTFDLLMNTSSKRFSRIINESRAGTGLSGLSMTNSLEVTPKVYVQAGLGIRTKIEFPSLSALKDSLGNIAINRTELILEVDENTIKNGASEKVYHPVYGLQLIKLDDEDSVRTYLAVNGNTYPYLVQQDFYYINNGVEYPLTVGFNETSSSYTFNISRYFHAILHGIEPNNGLIIAPTGTENGESVSRTLAGSGSAKVKIKVYYTKVD